MDWCCGEEPSFDKITNRFAFVPVRNRVLEILNDKPGYHLVAGTVVCLTSSIKKRKKTRKKKQPHL
jgi:hypothetical protein